MDKHLPEATPESVDHAHTEHIVPRRTFYAVFAVLILLTGLTTGVAFVDLGPFNTVAALTIAVLKMLLVALFFMHVKYSGLLTKVVVGDGEGLQSARNRRLDQLLWSRSSVRLSRVAV